MTGGAPTGVAVPAGIAVMTAGGASGDYLKDLGWSLMTGQDGGSPSGGGKRGKGGKNPSKTKSDLNSSRDTSQTYPSTKVEKVVNSNLPHAIDRAVERGVFPDKKSAADGLRELSDKIKQDGFPTGTLQDTAHRNRILVPVGNNGLAVYQIGKNGTAKLKTTLIAN